MLNEEAAENLHHVARYVMEGDGKVTHPAKACLLCQGMVIRSKVEKSNLLVVEEVFVPVGIWSWFSISINMTVFFLRLS